jgi:hypothetical protein
MTYGIKIELEIKTMGLNLTNNQLSKLISDAIWAIPEFRNVEISSFENDNEYKKPYPDMNLVKQVLSYENIGEC